MSDFHRQKLVVPVVGFYMCCVIALVLCAMDGVPFTMEGMLYFAAMLLIVSVVFALFYLRAYLLDKRAFKLQGTS